LKVSELSPLASIAARGLLAGPGTDEFVLRVIEEIATTPCQIVADARLLSKPG
jgi:hypothetical protein